MREHLGEGFPLMADANMKWTVEESIRAARAFGPYDLTWLEEPTIPDDVAGHALLVVEARHAVDAGRVHHEVAVGLALRDVDGGAGVVGDIHVQPGERVEEDGLADVRVAGEHQLAIGRVDRGGDRGVRVGGH